MSQQRRAAGLVLVVTALIASTRVVTPAQDAPAFRSETDAVRLDVSVQQRGRPVLNLRAADFDVRDAGVPQRVTDVSYERIALDVTIAFDVSRSVTGPTLAQLKRAVDQLRRRLRPDDRLKLLTFNMRVRRALDFTDATADPAPIFDALQPGGSTSLFDAVAVAMVSAAPPNRRQLVIVFSDGQETSSVTEPPLLVDVAAHTTATVAFVLSGAPVYQSFTGSPAPMLTADTGGRSTGAFIPPTSTLVLRSADPLISELAAATGGIVVPVAGDVAASFTRALDDLRSTYVLHFSPEGLPTKGFHPLQVRLTRSGTYEIRARRGYFAD